MFQKLFLASLTLFVSCATLLAQSSNEKDYFVINTDTTFCTKLTYKTTAQGILKSINYTDLSGKEKTFSENVQDVITIHHFGSTYDKIPFKANKPDGYMRFTKKMVDGVLKVYLAQQTTSSSGNVSGTYRFFIKMPDGSFHKINNKKNLNTIIKPFLLECNAFSSNYQGNFSTREKPFMETIEFYNSLCK